MEDLNTKVKVISWSIQKFQNVRLKISDYNSTTTHLIAVVDWCQIDNTCNKHLLFAII